MHLPFLVSTPAEKFISKFSFYLFLFFLDPDPHLASVVCDLYLFSVSRYELCVCVGELVYVCAYEHKFGVATNHGKF